MNPPSAIEEQALRAMQARVDKLRLEGTHVLSGPAFAPPYWRCTCGASFSNLHPAATTSRVHEAIEQHPLPWWDH
jgi:hypothetical protein